MAAELVIKTSIEVTGLGTETKLSNRFVHSVTPEEVFKGYMVVGTNAQNLDLGGIDEEDVLYVMIIAKGTADTDYIGILINDDGAGTPSTADGNIVLNAGDHCELCFDGSDSTPGLDDSQVIRVIGSAATSAIEYIVVGQNT